MRLGEGMERVDFFNKSFNIKKLNIKQLETLAENLREEIINTAKSNGGHLASNLGIIEATIALHYVFDLPKDKLIYDVGHQCYAHKILSKRANEFNSIRTNGGLSGFPDRQESEYDIFGTGHAGTSMAASLGIAKARDNTGQEFNVINLVGDGSFVNGLNLEALTADNHKPKNFVCIFNDNGMSISENKNGFYNILSKGTTKGWYVKNKKVIKKIFKNSVISRFLMSTRNFIKRAFNKNYYIEKFGFKYVGVVDGNDIEEMVKILQRVKNIAKNKAVFLHVKTVKGKGLEIAETQAESYHGVGKNLENANGVYSLALGEKLNELISKDKKIIAITAGMKKGTGLCAVEEKHPSNFIDVGIAEEYAVTLAGGLAVGGLKPVIAVYSTFLQRAYDQILHDVCLQNLPVVFCLDRSGFVGQDGKTHQGLFDLSYLSHIPNLKILAPSNDQQLKDMLEYALTLNSPVAIRYTKNQTYNYERENSVDKWEEVESGNEAVILAVGPNMINKALEVKKLSGLDISVVDARRVKPIDQEYLEKVKNLPIITLEENAMLGGFGATCLTYFTKKGINVKALTVGVEDEFVAHKSIIEQLDGYGFKAQDLASKIEAFIKTNR